MLIFVFLILLRMMDCVTVQVYWSMVLIPGYMLTWGIMHRDM